MRARIGVDVGGTFTDFAMVDEARDMIFIGKRLTTPGDPSLAITEGIDRLLYESDVAIGEVQTDVYGNPLCTTYVDEDPVTHEIPNSALDGDMLPVVDEWLPDGIPRMAAAEGRACQTMSSGRSRMPPG